MVSFAWRLVIVAGAVIDYVIIHELVHIHEKNYGKAFWNRVRVMMLDYKEKIEQFETNGHMLMI